MWFENGTEKARKQRNENSKRLIKSAILGNADISGILIGRKIIWLQLLIIDQKRCWIR